jgi:hypothetical protein
MLLFRSEEHVERWTEKWKQPKGATLTLAQGWGLAREWYHDRLSPDWKAKTTEEAMEAFSRLGLRNEFWRMR